MVNLIRLCSIERKVEYIKQGVLVVLLSTRHKLKLSGMRNFNSENVSIRWSVGKSEGHFID